MAKGQQSSPLLPCGWHFEREARTAGYCAIVGVDEVGRGPLFGPVVAAAVILPDDAKLPGLTDSKKMTEKKRDELEEKIRACAQSFAIAEVDAATIDRINIREASRLAMVRAVEQLKLRAVERHDFLLPDFLLIDGNTRIAHALPQRTIVKGDAQSLSIAAASVLAKVYRDRLIVALDSEFPGYGLAKHKGYGTAVHLAALNKFGPTKHHRVSFKPVRVAAGISEVEWTQQKNSHKLSLFEGDIETRQPKTQETQSN